MPADLPTADALKTWPTSKLLECFALLVSSQFRGSDRNATLRRLYAAEIDRRLPIPR